MTSKTEITLAQNGFAPERITPRIVEETQKILAIRGMLVRIAQEAEAHILESLWTIRREFGNDEGAEADFFDYAKAELGLTRDIAQKQLVTWAAARKNREVRALAGRAPLQAMRFVTQITAAAGDDVFDDEPQVTELLTMPPRKRSEAIRELIETRKAVEAGHNPADAEAIKTLQAERDAAIEALGKAQITNLADTPIRRVEQFTEKCNKLIEAARALVAESERILAGADWDKLPPSMIGAQNEHLAQLRTEITLTIQAVEEIWFSHTGGAD